MTVGRNYHYPQSPKHVDKNILKPTEAFRKEVIGVVVSILGFILTYIGLVIAAIGLAILCGWAGFWIISIIKNLWTLIIGVGLIGLGLMVLYFLFKFIFKRNTYDRSGMIEVTAKEQPLLFDFIKKLAKETQTPLPKRVYLSPDVSAAVFYDSGFWSMFLPIRKNLNIGLGLVNCVNVSEFKAVIAHEFGHFSQKSMKLGSYVYNVNHIIYDMLFENDDYERTLESWSNASQYFYIFAELTAAIVQIIKEILGKLYSGINERYMALSRQMEFHADAVAASVCGSSPLIHALYRLDVAHACYQSVLGHYDSWIKENRRALNVYQHHSIAMKNFAEAHHLTMEHNLVQVSANAFAKYHWNKVVIKDQWASHPDTNEREKHLNKLDMEADIVTESAWTLFKDAEDLQQKVTEQFYTEVSFEAVPQLVDNEAFRKMLDDNREKYSFNKAYKGFYDNRNITVFDVEEIIQHNTTAQNLSEILTEKTLSLPFQIAGLKMDIQMLEPLQLKSSAIKSFDFEGRKYDRSDAAAVILKLRQELKSVASVLERADKDIFLLFVKKAALTGSDKIAVAVYNDMFSLFKKTEDELNQVNSMVREASQLFKNNVTQGMALAVTNNMKRKGDDAKNMIKKMFEDENYANYYSEADKKTLQMFIDDKRKYFFNTGFDSDAILLFIEALNTFGRIISERSFAQTKLTLDTQLRVIQGEVEALNGSSITASR